MRKKISEIRTALASMESYLDAPENYTDFTTSDNWTGEEPAPEEETDKAAIYIKDLNESTQLKDRVIYGQIETVGKVTYFDKGTGKPDGQVINILLSDETGNILSVWWDDMVAKVCDFHKGQHIRITDAWQVKRGKQGKLELHPGKFAKIEVVE